MNGVQLRCTVECSVLVPARCQHTSRKPVPGEGGGGLGTPRAALSEAWLQLTLASGPPGPQPDPCFAQKPHTHHFTQEIQPGLLTSCSQEEGKKTCKVSHGVVF